MPISIFHASQTDAIVELFTQVFSDSESEKEGEVIGSFVAELIKTTKPEELVGFISNSEDAVLVGAVFFSRLVVPSGQNAFILSPMAIATNKQGKGDGQKLINYGLNYLKSIGVELIFTYGDPNYYSRVGFKPLDESVVKAPLKLSYPEGWLVNSLDSRPVVPMVGVSKCVEALNCQALW